MVKAKSDGKPKTLVQKLKPDIQYGQKITGINSKFSSTNPKLKQPTATQRISKLSNPSGIDTQTSSEKGHISTRQRFASKKETRLQSQETLDKANHKMVVDAYFTTQKELDSTQDLHDRPKVIKKPKKFKKKKNDHSMGHM